MRHLENAFKFTFKNFLIALPLLIASAIPTLIIGVGSIGTVFNVAKFQKIFEDASNGYGTNSMDIFKELYPPAFIGAAIFAGLLSIAFTIIVQPATYGMINKAYETGSVKLNDFGACLSKYIGRYILFGLLYFAIGLGMVVAMGILVAIAIGIMTVSQPIGILLLVIFVLASIVAIVALTNYMTLWFPAICVEDSGVTDGLKNSFKAVSGSFWPIFGITLLISLAGNVASSFLGAIFGLIPVVGNIVPSAITTLAQFVLMVYYFEVYREKTGRFTLPEPPQSQFGNMPNNGVQ